MTKPADIIILLLAILLLTFNCTHSPSIATQKDVEVIIDRVIEAYGGSALESVHSFKMEGTVQGVWCIYKSALRVADSSVVPLTRFYVEPGDTRVDYQCQGESKPFSFFIDENHAGSTETYYGAIAWGDLLDWEKRWGDYEKAERKTFTLPWFLQKNRAKLEKIKSEKNDNSSNVVIGGIHIDTGDYRIHKFEHYAGAGWLYRRTTVIFTDFRKIQGVLFPHREEHYLASSSEEILGEHYGTVIINRITINPEIDPDIFHPTEKELEEMRERKEQIRKSR